MTPATVIILIGTAIDHLEELEPVIAGAVGTPAGVQSKITAAIADVHTGLAALQQSENNATVAKPIVQRILDDLSTVTMALAALPLPPPGPAVMLGLQMLIPVIGGFAHLIWPTAVATTAY